MRTMLAILMLTLAGCAGPVAYDDVTEPTLLLVQQPIAGIFTHPGFAYSEGYGWGMVELLRDGPAYSTPPRITHGTVRGRWHGETARAFWTATVQSGKYAEWTRPYQLGDSNAWAVWMNEIHPLPGFKLGNGAVGGN